MNVPILIKNARVLLNQNSSVILTGVGVAGTISTAVLTGRATVKATRATDTVRKFNCMDKLVRENGSIVDVDLPKIEDLHLPKKEIVKLTWKYYLPPFGVGAITIAAIVMAHRMDAKKIVALTVASGVSERALKEYKEKVVEKIGPRQETKIRDEIAQDRVNNTSGSELVIVGDGKVLCMDALTGRYFESSMDQLQTAKNEVNHMLINYDSTGVSLSEFFDRIGLESTVYSDNNGWNPDVLVELEISAAIAPNGQPCMVVDYKPHPFVDFIRLT